MIKRTCASPLASSVLVTMLFVPLGGAAFGERLRREIRLGHGQRIMAVHHGSREGAVVAGAAPSYPHPRPRLAGFSPYVAVTTSTKRSSKDIDFEHDLETIYPCNPDRGPIGGQCGSPNPPASANFVVGILDSGAVVDLAAGSGAATLGMDGPYLTPYFVEIGGTSGTVSASVTQPLGIYAAGLSAVDGGILDISAVVGHSNTSALAAPPIECGGVEAVSALIGTPFLSFYTAIIRVDTPRTATVAGSVFAGPDVQIQALFDSIPEFEHAFSMQFGGLSPVATASYFPDLEDLVTPLVPTQLSLSSLSFPTGGVFFSRIYVVQGEPSPTNPLVELRVMVDTGAQSSIISPGVAADLNLPRDPDFTVDVCGVGGITEGVPGYYIDYLQINASGGPLKFSRMPFVVLDLPSPEGGPLDGVLGMNAFWNRNVIFEPSLTGSAFFHVSAPVSIAFGDSDVNLRVDAYDAAYFVGCWTAPRSAGVSAECDHLDADFDHAVDLHDFSDFQNCFSGSSLADPTCSE